MPGEGDLGRRKEDPHPRRMGRPQHPGHRRGIARHQHQALALPAAPGLLKIGGGVLALAQVQSPLQKLGYEIRRG